MHTKKIWFFFLIFLMFVSNFFVIFAKTENVFITTKQTGNILRLANKLEYIQGEVLVKFKSEEINLKSTRGRMNAKFLATSHDMSQMETIPQANLAILHIDDSTTVEEKIQELQTNPNVEYAEPNYIYYPQSFNDTYSGSLRGLPKISAYQAFTIFSGNANPSVTGTIVAVIDVGVAYDHPDLLNQMRNGSNCKDQNGNTLGSCLYGYDFVDNDNNPYPVRSTHGTHIAGIIGAQANNMAGVIGVNFNAKIMAIRAGDEHGFTTSDIIKGIDFARQNGAKVINASFGGPEYSSGLYESINAFKLAGGLFVAAAGNDGTNNEITHTYPCDYTLDNIICVAATDQSDTLAAFSNYGANSVDVGAPGVSIYSTVPTIVSSTHFLENFESILTGMLPNGRSTGGTQPSLWGVKDIGGDWGRVLYGDTINYPYSSNINSTIQKSINTLNTSGVSINFWTMCDTQYSSTNWIDYMVLEASADGSNFQEIGKWDEQYLDTIDSNNLSYHLTGVFISPNFTFRFRWVTDGSDNNYAGCIIDDMRVLTYKVNTIGEPYANMDGTSMATPYVAGLASLARSMRPDLGYQSIKLAIIGSGDTLSSLSGKTVGGTRINAYNTLLALGGPIIDRSSIYTSIGLGLSGSGIANNFSSVTNTNVTNFSGLYFAKYLGSDEVGKIIFNTGLNLTDTGTQNFLQNDLQQSIGINNGKIRFLPGTGFAGKNAILKMNFPASFSGFLSNIQNSDLLVREGSGGLVIATDVIDAIWTGSCIGDSQYACPLYISVGHFTSFELKPKLIQVHLESNNIHKNYATSGNIVTLSFTGSESLTGVSVIINGSIGHPIGTGTSWYVTKEITTGDSETDVAFLITYQDLEGNTGLQNMTTDHSSVLVDHTLPLVSRENNVTVNNSTATYKITTSESGSVAYTGAGSCVSITSPVSVVSGSNTLLFTLPNATYSGCQLQVSDVAGNRSERIEIPMFTVNYTPSSGGGGGGGGNILPTCKTSQLICISSKYELKDGENCSSSKIGTACDMTGILLEASSGQKDIILNTGINMFGLNTLGSITNSPFSSELNQAYLYAYTLGITTMPSIQKANMTGNLIRSHMAKMMVNYMTKIMTGRVENPSRICIFSDIQQESEEIQAYINLACKFGIMGVGVSQFSPNQEVTRAQFATVLSRVLYGDTYNGGSPYYKNHLDILKENGILTNTDPTLQELRGYVMLMLMRSQDIQ